MQDNRITIDEEEYFDTLASLVLHYQVKLYNVPNVYRIYVDIMTGEKLSLRGGGVMTSKLKH